MIARRRPAGCSSARSTPATAAPAARPHAVARSLGHRQDDARARRRQRAAGRRLPARRGRQFDTLMELRTQMRAADLLFVEEVHLQAIQELRGKESIPQPEVLFGLMKDRTITAATRVLPYPRITVVGATNGPWSAARTVPQPVPAASASGAVQCGRADADCVRERQGAGRAAPGRGRGDSRRRVRGDAAADQPVRAQSGWPVEGAAAVRPDATPGRHERAAALREELREGRGLRRRRVLTEGHHRAGGGECFHTASTRSPSSQSSDRSISVTLGS
jgi:hypothetical protein